MFIILAYAPILLLLPVLLLIGVVFVVVPGGFIIVLAGLYYAAAGFTSLLGLEVTRRWRARRSRVRRADTSFENASRSGRSIIRSPGSHRPEAGSRRGHERSRGCVDAERAAQSARVGRRRSRYSARTRSRPGRAGWRTGRLSAPRSLRRSPDRWGARREPRRRGEPGSRAAGQPARGRGHDQLLGEPGRLRAGRSALPAAGAADAGPVVCCAHSPGLLRDLASRNGLVCRVAVSTFW